MKISNWWNNNMNENNLNIFKDWVGEFDAESKVFVRKYIISKNYASILDVGCGMCDTYYGYKNDNYDINYIGLDSCRYFIDNAIKNNINVIESDMNKINIPDNSFDIVYGRHILEHLTGFQDALSEFIRISKYEVVIVFFIKPEDTEQIRYDSGLDLYHNVYSKKDIGEYLKGYNFEWFDVNDKEIILSIKK